MITVRPDGFVSFFVLMTSVAIISLPRSSVERNRRVFRTGLQSGRVHRLLGLRVHSQARRLRLQRSPERGVQEQVQRVPKDRVRSVGGIGGTAAAAARQQRFDRHPTGQQLNNGFFQ